MKIQFLGAAQTVTGSCYMMSLGDKRFAVDCGLHQGNTEIERRNQAMDVYDPANVDFFILTHAHMDHSGLLPMMVKGGFKGPVFATAPTRDLLEIMLLDSAHIQEMEAEWRSRKRRRFGTEPVEPLYTSEHALAASKLIKAMDYGQTFSPVSGVEATFHDAGHILGSAFLQLNVKENGETWRLLFSGDLGRPDALLMSDPSPGLPADYLFMESTYGNRDHKNESESLEELAEAIQYSFSRGEKVIIPAFAVERSQEVIYTLFKLDRMGKLPKSMPVFLDSPLAIRATEIFRKHVEYLDGETKQYLDQGLNPLDLPNLRFTLKTDESREINTYKGSAIVISASGMCNAGRIKHHLRHNLWRKGASVVFVGYQAQGTPGRRIVDGAKRIRIMGEDVAVTAKVFTIGGFSAHAGQSQLLDWLGAFGKPPMEVFLVHGEGEAINTLGGLVKERYGLTWRAPEYLETCELAPGRPMDVVTHADKAFPRIDWNYILGDTETKVAELRKRLAELEAKPWVDQTELRDRLRELNGQLVDIISEM